MDLNPHEHAANPTAAPLALLPLIESIYQAADDPSIWAVVLRHIAEVSRADGAILVASLPDLPSPGIVVLARMGSSMLEGDVKYSAPLGISSHRCHKFSDKPVRYRYVEAPNANFERDDIYTDLLKPTDDSCSLGIKVPLDDEACAYLSLVRPKRAGHFAERESLVLLTIFPHLQRALRLHLRLSQLRANATGMGAALDAFGHAVFGLSRQGKVVFLNSSARRIAQAGDGIQMIDGRLLVQDGQVNTQLQSLIAEAISAGVGHGRSSGEALHAPCRHQGPLSILVSPFAPALMPGYGQLAALVFVSSRGQKVQSRAVVLRGIFKLTPSEARLADLLLEGLDVRQAADRMKITYHSARSLLKPVFQKTGVSSQSALIRLLLQLPSERPDSISAG